MGGLVDVARFRADDPAELVTASLACPICLCSDEVAWSESLVVYEEAADCRCRRCERRWRVYLQPHQLLRLDLLRTAGG